MIVDRFVFGVDPYPNWFKEVSAKYVYDETGEVLLSVIITNPTGDVLTAYVGDTILRIPDPPKGSLCLVYSGVDRRV